MPVLLKQPITATQAYELGRGLRQAREDRGLTLTQAAEAADLFPTWITQIEGGEIHDLETLRDYARALGARLAGRRGRWVRSR